MTFGIVLFLAGAALAALTLSDVFDTVVVPGGSRAALNVARRLNWLLLPVWKRVRGRRRGLSPGFAPTVLVGSFILWMALLSVGFGLMAYAARTSFDPPLASLPQSIYVVGSSLVTVGLSAEKPLGFARWIILAAGFCGLAVMTMAVTYLLQVQSSISRRDIGIIKLNTSAGDPPSALTLLERFAAIGNRPELAETLREGRNWCATVRQSHTAHPSLIYFQSIGTGAGWPAALGALLDLALLVQHCIADEALVGPAILLRDEGTKMARDLAATISLDPVEAKTDQGEILQAVQRLADSGYAMRDIANPQTVSDQRATHMSCVNALADHLGKPTTVLVRQN
jgi:hypothetical protein